MEANNNITRYATKTSDKLFLDSNWVFNRFKQYVKNPEQEKTRIRNKISMQGALSKNTSASKKDVFKDTPVRYLGFTNELGAAVSNVCQGTKGLIGKIPAISWVPAIGYIVLDVADKYKKGENGTGKKKVRAGASELCTQMLQSVALPTFVIKGVQTIGKKACDKFAKNPAFKNGGKWGKIITTGASLAALFATIKPIDKLTEKIMNKIINPILGLEKQNKDECILINKAVKADETDCAKYKENAKSSFSEQGSQDNNYIENDNFK